MKKNLLYLPATIALTLLSSNIQARNESAKVPAKNIETNHFIATKAGIQLVTNHPVDQHLRLQLALDSIHTDDVYIGFDKRASTNYVSNEDAPYMPGYGKVSLCSISSDNVALAINKLPFPGLNPTIIKLKVGAIASGHYKLNMTEIKNIPELYEIWLIDLYKKDSLDMKHNKTYGFEINSDTNSYGSNRFKLVIRQNQALELHLLSFTAVKSTGAAEITWKTENEQNWTYFTVERSTDNGAIFDVLGGFSSGSIGSYSLLDKAPFPSGAKEVTNKYRLRMEDVNGTISYSKVVALNFSVSNNDAVNNNLALYPNPVKSFINVTIYPNTVNLRSDLSAFQTQGTIHGLSTTNLSHTYGIKIININGSIIKKAISSTSNWESDVSNLSPGTYIIQVVNNDNNSLVGKSTFVKL